MKPTNLITDKPWTLKRKSKMGNKRTRVDGISFQSIREAGRYTQLKALRDDGDVIMFHRQPIFDLGGGTTYRADFQIFWADGSVTYEDVKGYRTATYIKAKKQTEALYPVTIEEV